MIPNWYLAGTHQLSRVKKANVTQFGKCDGRACEPFDFINAPWTFMLCKSTKKNTLQRFSEVCTKSTQQY
jgi:hypothetical protein